MKLTIITWEDKVPVKTPRQFMQEYPVLSPVLGSDDGLFYRPELYTHPIDYEEWAEVQRQAAIDNEHDVMIFTLDYVLFQVLRKVFYNDRITMLFKLNSGMVERYTAVHSKFVDEPPFFYISGNCSAWILSQYLGGKK